MKPRRRLWVGLLVLLLLGGLSCVPAVRWRVVGWTKGEAFFQGRPTSYWRREMLLYDDAFQADLQKLWDALSGRKVVSSPPDWFTRARDYLGHDPLSTPALFGDPAAVPVLAELAKDQDDRVRSLADKYLDEIAHRLGHRPPRTYLGEEFRRAED